MKRKHWAFIFVIAVLLGGVLAAFIIHRRYDADEPRRDALAFAGRLEETLAGRNGLAVRDFVIVPGAYRSRTVQEQEDFLRKALKDEISAKGLAELKRIGQYGPLVDVFPESGPKWAKQFGADPGDCVAFKAERNGLLAELVLLQTNSFYRVLRCNNVAQLAKPQ